MSGLTFNNVSGMCIWSTDRTAIYATEYFFREKVRFPEVTLFFPPREIQKEATKCAQEKVVEK